MDMQGLSTICAGLGISEEDENGRRIGYSKGEYCLDNLKDLLRFLRRDDPQTREVFKQVCKWNNASKDLIPIIEHCQDDRNLVLNAVKILVFLTMPIEPSSSDIPQQIEYLWGLKSSITCSNTVAVVVSLLETPLENLECEAFTEDDWKLVQLVLTLFRNILAIQDISLHQKSGGSAFYFLSLRDKFLELLFHENVMDLILVITQHVGGSSCYFRQDNLLLLETFHYIFMGQEPELIAKAPLKGSKAVRDTKASLDCLKSIMEEEKQKRKLSRQCKIARHSQFSGTFTRFTTDGSKAVVKGDPMSASRDTLLKPHKFHRGPSKKIVWDHRRLTSINDSIFELLHDFVNQFLSGGYNVLMQSICEDIVKEHPAIQNSDIVVFFHVAQFVTSFQHHKLSSFKPNTETDMSEACSDYDADSTYFKGDICGPIAASMNESMFLLVISRWRNAYEGLKETHDYKFLSAAGSLMKTMFGMLDLVLKLSPENSKEPQTARILLYKLFYDQTDQGMTHFLLNLIKSFDTHKQPKSDLADLIEMINLIVQLMENLQARGILRVSKKARKVKNPKALNGKRKTDNKPLGEHAIIQDEIGIPDSDQSADIPETLQVDEPDGSADIPEAAQVPEISVLEMGNHVGNLLQVDNKNADGHTNDDYGTSDSSGDEQPPATDEVDFRLSNLISAFANSNIIRNLCWLLRFYKSNSASTNHNILYILQKITDDLQLSPMLYQLSLLTIFYEILAEQKSAPCKEHTTIVNFLTRFIRKMLKKMKTQPLLFVEVLFWKTNRECHYINAEHLSHELRHLKQESRNLANASGDGEVVVSQSKGWTRRSIADALGEDEADIFISHELGNQKDKGNSGEVEEGFRSNSNSEIGGKENSDHGVDSMEHESERVSKRKRRPVLNEGLEVKIKELYEKFKDRWNCSRLISEALDSEGQVSPAQVAKKLKQLGLRVVSKKKLHEYDAVGSFSADPNQPAERGERGSAMEAENASYNSSALDGSLLRQPLHTRKRVHAFSEDQESMIRDLFERFKNHKRCSYMIANAMSDNNKFTAAEVSHKLKQLGLRVSRQKRTENNKHLRDEKVANLSADEVQESDKETLLSLRKRKSRKLFQKSKNGKVSTVLIQKTATENNSGNEVTVDVTERDRSISSGNTKALEIDEGLAFNQVSMDNIQEAEVTANINENLLGENRIVDLPEQPMEDELADSGDDMNYELSTSAVSRRKLRMIVDLEDDD